MLLAIYIEDGGRTTMIDIHTHILPGIDDGAADWQETVALARAAAAEGIRIVIATPHHADGAYENVSGDIRRLTAEANARLEAEGILLQVLPGHEVHVHTDLLDAWSRGDLVPLADRGSLLLEMDGADIPPRFEELIHELSLCGIRVIIAHPERNAEVVRHPERLSALIDAGAYAQVTSHSLLGGFGRRVEQHAWSLCRAGLIHIVASDAHHVARRGFRLREAYDRIAEQLGSEAVEGYKRNAEAVANGGPLQTIRPASRSVRPIWRSLRGLLMKK